jgi:hypothetical protein
VLIVGIIFGQYGWRMTMEISKQDWEHLKQDVKEAKEAAKEAVSDRGHTFIIIMLIIIFFQGC